MGSETSTKKFGKAVWGITPFKGFSLKKPGQHHRGHTMTRKSSSAAQKKCSSHVPSTERPR